MTTNTCKISTLRDAITKVTKILSERDIQVTQQGADAFVEPDSNGIPKRVNIPFIADDATDEFICAIKGFLDHEVGHVLHTDFKACIQAAKEGERVKSMWNIIEDAFVEDRQRMTFRGTNTNLNQLFSYYTSDSVEPMLIKLNESGEANASKYAGVLMPSIARAWSGVEFFQKYMHDKWELVNEFIEQIPAEHRNLESLTDSMSNLELARIWVDALFEKEPEEECGDGDSDSSESDEGEMDEIDALFGPSDEESDETDEGEGYGLGEREESDDSEEAGSSGSACSSDEPSDEESDEETDGDKKVRGSSGDTGTAQFDEFKELSKDFSESVSESISAMARDDMSQRDKWTPYTRDWDVIDFAPSEVRDSYVSKVKEKVNKETGKLQKQLERHFAAANRSYWNKGLERGRLDTRALGKIRAGNMKVFKKREVIKSKNTAIQLVVDCSGSMSGSKIRVATESAWAMAEVLDKIGIPCEVIGFTSTETDTLSSFNMHTQKQAYYRERGEGNMSLYSRFFGLYLPIFKSFSERMGTEQRKRLAKAHDNAYYMYQNTDGECLMHAYRRLAQRREENKVMIVFSDGYPANSETDRYLLHEHLQQVVKDIEKTGTSVFGIGIDTDSVESFYDNHQVIYKLEDLPGALMECVKSSLF